MNDVFVFSHTISEKYYAELVSFTGVLFALNNSLLFAVFLLCCVFIIAEYFLQTTFDAKTAEADRDCFPQIWGYAVRLFGDRDLFCFIFVHI